MAASISSSIIACLKSFNSFLEETRRREEGNLGGLVVGVWEDELGRLRMWAGNIGAHQTGQSSLDFRLRDASHVREQIIKLLQSLLDRLQDVKNVLAEDEERNDDGVVEDLMDEDDPKTEIQELQESLVTIINCLFQMSILVRKPAQHDVHSGSQRTDAAAFEPFDYNHVREKYPGADEVLIKRLGTAITRRRKYLKYRERHAIKLRQGIDDVAAAAPIFRDVHEGETTKQIDRSVISETVATDFQNHNINFDDNASDTGISQTSYASSLISGGSVTIPAPPISSLGGASFECPYCFCIITVKQNRSWNKHVFQDLQPYICIAPTCVTPDRLYSTRQEWLHHSKMAHSTATTDDREPRESDGFATCPLCKDIIKSERLYDRHLARHLQDLALFVLPPSEEGSDLTEEDQNADSDSNVESTDLAATQGRPKSLDEAITHLSLERLEEAEKHDQGKYEESQEMYRRALDGREKTVGEEDPNTLTTIDNLASSLIAQGKYEEAEEMNRRALEGKEKVLGWEHPDTLTSVSNLALVLEYQRKYEAAEEMNRRVLEGREKALGKEHPDTLTSVSSLALVLRNQGKYEEAEEMNRRALEGREKVLGVEHPDTLTSVSNLASVLRYQGKYEAAEEMNRRVLEGREKALGKEHPDTLTSVSNLALVLEYQGKYEAAEEMGRRALFRREKVLGREHLETLTSVNDLASVLLQQGKYEVAEEIYRRALDGNGKALGKEHPNTLTTVNNLALVLGGQGKYEEAEEMGRRALEGREKALGKESPDTLMSVYHLAHILHTQKQYKEATTLYERSCGGLQKMLGPNHRLTLECSKSYASMIEEMK